MENLRWRLIVVSGSILAGTALVAAGCGSSSSRNASQPTTVGGALSNTSSCPAQPDSSLDARDGAGAGLMQQMIECGAAKPLKATGTPVVVGFINSQGDPQGSFPDSTAGAEAAVSYINDYLGGVGGDPANGTPGKPIKLDTCFMTINPAEAVSCANQMAAANPKPTIVVNSLDFFSPSVLPILQKAGETVVEDQPIEVSDGTTAGVYTLSPGGGCDGEDANIVDFVVNTLHAKTVAAYWEQVPPGEACYADGTQKILREMQGKVKGAGSVAQVSGLTFKGIPFAAAASNLTAQASEALSMHPDAIIACPDGQTGYSLLSALAQEGWSAQKTPLVWCNSTLETQQIAQAGSAVNGVDWAVTDVPSAPYLYTGLRAMEVNTANTMMKKYQQSQAITGLEADTFTTLMTILQTLDQYSKSSGASSIGSAGYGAFLAQTKNEHQWANETWGCATAPQNYPGLCTGRMDIAQWDGSKFKLVATNLNGVQDLSGTTPQSTILPG